MLGNPPWDAIQPLAKEFFAAFDLRIIDAPTRRERADVEARLLAESAVLDAYAGYLAAFERSKRVLSRTFGHVGRQADGRPSGAVLDIWQGFAERGASVLARGGRVGWVLPSAFHANQSATGLRHLYLERMALRCCYSFENRNKLFDIDSRFKFAVVVAENDREGTRELDCAFYLHDLDWLFPPKAPLRFTLDLVRKTGGGYLNLLELRKRADLDTAQAVFRSAGALAGALASMHIRMGPEIDMSKGAHLFTPTFAVLADGADPRDPKISTLLRERGYLPLHEGKTFHQYDDRWEDRPRYCVALTALADKPEWLRAARHYRLTFRDIARSTDERTGIFCLLPPGFIFGNKAPSERGPHQRPTGRALLVLAVADSFAFDFVLRMKVQATVNLFILNGCPFPRLDAAQRRFLAHSALRLTCNHAGYAALWTEQLGDAWREPAARHTWPMLAGADARWAVRAAIDAVVARAYGLTREQYAHVLASFSHRSYPKAPELCLAALDELTAIGLEAFCHKHDPYSDVPLNESLPEPVIDLPIPGEAPDTTCAAPRPAPEPSGQLSLFGSAPSGPPLGSARSVFPVPGSPAPDSRRPAAASRFVQALEPDTYQRIALLLEERGIITSADAQALTGLDAAAVRPALRRLVEQGKAVMEGARRGTRYRLLR